MVYRFMAMLGNTMRGGVTSLDQFSNKIVFTYNGKSKFKTFIGGCYSIGMFMIIVAYAYILGNIMLNRSRSNISISTEIVDLSNNPKVHYPGLNGFSFAFAISDSYGTIYELDDSLYTVKWEQITFSRTNGTVHSYVSEDIEFRR